MHMVYSSCKEGQVQPTEVELREDDGKSGGNDRVRGMTTTEGSNTTTQPQSDGSHSSMSEASGYSHKGLLEEEEEEESQQQQQHFRTKSQTNFPLDYWRQYAEQRHSDNMSFLQDGSQAATAIPRHSCSDGARRRGSLSMFVPDPQRQPQPQQQKRRSSLSMFLSSSLHNNDATTQATSSDYNEFGGGVVPRPAFQPQDSVSCLDLGEDDFLDASEYHMMDQSFNAKVARQDLKEQRGPSLMQEFVDARFSTFSNNLQLLNTHVELFTRNIETVGQMIVGTGGGITTTSQQEKILPTTACACW